MLAVGRPSSSVFCGPIARHSSTELDDALISRLLSEIGLTAAPVVLLTLNPLRVPSRSTIAVFLSPSLNSAKLTSSVNT